MGEALAEGRNNSTSGLQPRSSGVYSRVWTRHKREQTRYSLIGFLRVLEQVGIWGIRRNRSLPCSGPALTLCLCASVSSVFDIRVLGSVAVYDGKRPESLNEGSVSSNLLLPFSFLLSSSYIFLLSQSLFLLPVLTLTLSSVTWE